MDEVQQVLSHEPGRGATEPIPGRIVRVGDAAVRGGYKDRGQYVIDDPRKERLYLCAFE